MPREREGESERGTESKEDMARNSLAIAILLLSIFKYLMDNLIIDVEVRIQHGSSFNCCGIVLAGTSISMQSRFQTKLV